MEMSGERMIAASPAEVWAALNDPEVLKASIPGCEEMEKTSPTEFTAIVVQKVGPVRARFTGEVELTDIVEGQSYRITGRGKGGAAGAATGGAVVVLQPADEGTLLKYEAEAKVTGKIAQLGSRLISGFAKKMADQFFDRFKEKVEGGDAAVAEDDGPEDVAERIDDRTREIAGKAGAVADRVTSAISDAADEVYETARGTYQDLTDKDGKSGDKSAVESIDEQSREAAKDAGGVIDKVTGAIEDTVEKSYEATREVYHDLTDKDESGRSKIEKAAEELDDQSREAARDAGEAVDKVTDAIEEAVEDVGKAIADSPPAKKSFWKRLFGG